MTKKDEEKDYKIKEVKKKEKENEEKHYKIHLSKNVYMKAKSEKKVLERLGKEFRDNTVSLSDFDYRIYQMNYNVNKD